MISRIPAHIRIIRYGAPRMSSIVGAHHNCFTRRDGLTLQAAAPSKPPTIEMVAAGLCRRTHEQTVSLLKTIATNASAMSRPNAIQREFVSMMQECGKIAFFAERLASSATSGEPGPTTKGTQPHETKAELLPFVVLCVLCGFLRLSSSLLPPSPAKLV